MEKAEKEVECGCIAKQEGTIREPSMSTTTEGQVHSSDTAQALGDRPMLLWDHPAPNCPEKSFLSTCDKQVVNNSVYEAVVVYNVHDVQLFCMLLSSECTPATL